MSFAREYTLRAPSAPAPRAAARPRAQSFVSGAPAPVTAPAAEPSPRPAAHYPDTTRQLIGPAEVQYLAIAAVQAWKKVHSIDKAAVPGRTKKEQQDYWRHEQVALATEGRADGLTKMMRADFRNVLGRFLDLAGLSERAFQVLMRTGKNKHGDAVESVEQCDRWILGLLARVKRFFATQGPKAEERTQAWLREIVQYKEEKAGAPWTDWPVKQRTQLYWTLKRAAAPFLGAPKKRAPRPVPASRPVASLTDLMDLPEQPF